MNAKNNLPSLAWLKSIIRQRKHLISSGKSLKNDPQTISSFEYLKRHIDMLSFNDDYQVKRFIINNYEKIEKIIPGARCRGAEKKRRELHNFLSF